MLYCTNYTSLEEAINYFMTLLPELNSNRIASISKYARVDNEEIRIQARKSISWSGISWSLEIALESTS